MTTLDERLRLRPDTRSIGAVLAELAIRPTRVWGLTFELPRGVVRRRTRRRIRRGSYEQPEARAVAALVDPSVPMLELGGGTGVLSCLIASLLPPTTPHVVVEGNAHAFSMLERNRDRNGFDFEAVHGMVDYPRSGDPAKAGARAWGPGHQVRATDASAGRPVTLRGLLEERGWDRCNLLMDIEGAEVGLIEAEAEILRDRVASLVVELHPKEGGPEVAAATLRRILDTGLELVSIDATVFGFRAAR